MRTFFLTSTAWKGQIEIIYNDSDLLLSCDLTKAVLSEPQHLWFLKRMPGDLAGLKQLIDNTSTAKMTEINQEITFEMFWSKYDDKVRSSRKKAERIFNRMTRANQVRAFRHISTYEASRPSGVAKKYAETYLNAETWNN